MYINVSLWHFMLNLTIISAYVIIITMTNVTWHKPVSLGEKSRMLLPKTPLDRALLISNRLPIVTVLLSVTYKLRYRFLIIYGSEWRTLCWCAIKKLLTDYFDWRFRSPIPSAKSPHGGPGPLSNTMLLGTMWVSRPNGISFWPSALAGCMSVTDRQTNQGYVIICQNRQNCRFQQAMPPNNVVPGRVV